MSSRKKDSSAALMGLVGNIQLASRVSAVAEAEPTELPLSVLAARRNQPRRFFDETALNELADSIRAKGILQPLLVRPASDGQFEVIAGERRLRAAQLAALTSVPVRVHPCSDTEADQLALIENLQRRDLDRYEDVSSKLRLIAAAWKVSEPEAKTRLRRLRKHPGEDPEKVQQVESLFRLVGSEKWTSFVSNGLAILDLPETLLRVMQAGRLPYSKAVLLARAPQEYQEALLNEVLELGLSFEALRGRIAALTPGRPSGITDAQLKAVRRQLTPDTLDQLPPAKKVRVKSLLAQLSALLT
ncbi:ParB/RepB/Spo0J family partition protein (plasmid) [Deinococcus taeanensis]|uniref:ParB/RepB/Spo0J family partition protein n=1 Tax=Deinococcus taeanensis TaxID=2737050 RepID=UPI001CDB4F43|nr:ParB/RepB/Spo0J family partition protein [Deinococcus taeanensis]UBV45384.1 ParB/RepB/Spo0J family partition protein [Deinococcus taeanensis]